MRVALLLSVSGVAAALAPRFEDDLTLAQEHELLSGEQRDVLRKFWADWAKEQARTGWASRQSLGQFSDARYWNQLVSSAVPLSE